MWLCKNWKISQHSFMKKVARSAPVSACCLRRNKRKQGHPSQKLSAPSFILIYKMSTKYHYIQYSARRQPSSPHNKKLFTRRRQNDVQWKRRILIIKYDDFFQQKFNRERAHALGNLLRVPHFSINTLLRTRKCAENFLCLKKKKKSLTLAAYFLGNELSMQSGIKSYHKDL